MRISGREQFKKYRNAAAAECSNGIFVGRCAGGICEWKGIPYAKSPVGRRRWKAPEPAQKSEGMYTAFFYGPSPIQTRWPSETASAYRQSEDCLYLNVWAAKGAKNCPVMVFFHGGSYGWGGTSDTLYDGKNMISAHPDVVLVTVGYRTGIMGFIDLSEVPGGEEYACSGNLGLLDMVESLRYIKENIASFGGDPDNVTVFGESAGAGAVSLLPLMDGTKGLFSKVIAESGSIALTYSKSECRRLTRMLLKESGAATMDGLLALTEDRLKDLNKKLNDYNNFPERDGVILPENLYKAYAEGKASHVKMIIGTNADEARYWIREMGYYFPLVNGKLLYTLGLPVMFETNMKNASEDDKKRVRAFMRRQKGRPVWKITEFYNEMLFRLPAVFQAEAISRTGGEAYMYYWTYPCAIGDLGACHAVELAYVFRNTGETKYTGDNVSEELSGDVCSMWTQFAKTGDPSIPGKEWPKYGAASRTTMILGDEIKTEDAPKDGARKLLKPLLKLNFNGCYTNISWKVPSLWVMLTAIIGGTVAILAGGAALFGKLFGKD